MVHVHGLKADGFHAVVAARLAMVPRVLVTVHGSTADSITAYQRVDMKLRRWVVGQLIEPVTLRMADAVYCVCDAQTRRPRICRHAGSRLRETIYNGVQAGSSGSRDPLLRRSLGLGPSDIVLIYTGRVTWDKGLDVLAASLQEILVNPAAPKNLKLLLVGDGPDFSDIRARFQPLIQSGHVIMTGRRADIPALNASADVFVFPSFAENLSFSLLEAMAASLPIIATHVGGNSEVVIQGQTGLLVPTHDATALAQAILKLAVDRELRERQGLAGRARLLSIFSSEATTSKTAALYESLLAGS